MGVLLILRSVRAGAIAQAQFPAFSSRDHWRLLTALALCLTFALGLRRQRPAVLARRSDLRRRLRFRLPVRRSARRAGTLVARRSFRRRVRTDLRRRRSITRSRICSWFGCPERAMFDGLLLFGQSIANFATPTTILYALGACLIGLIIGALARPDRHHGRGADDDADHLAAVERRAADPDLHLCRRDLWRQPQRHPAEHSGHARLRRVLPRRLRAGAAGARRPRHGHRHHRLGARHLDRDDRARLVHAGARRGGAEIRRLRILLARGVRRRDLRQPHRQRPAEGLDRGISRPVHRLDRPGGHVCL